MLILQDSIDPLFEKAARLIVQKHCWTATMLQESLKIDKKHATNLLDEMVTHGILRTTNTDLENNLIIHNKEEIDDLICEIENRDINLIWDYNNLSINITKGEFYYDTNSDGIEMLQKIIFEFKIKNTSNTELNIYINDIQYHSQRYGAIKTQIYDNLGWIYNTNRLTVEKNYFLYFKLAVNVNGFYNNDILNFGFHYYKDNKILNDIEFNIKYQIKYASRWGVELIHATQSYHSTLLKFNNKYSYLYTNISFPKDSSLPKELFNLKDDIGSELSDYQLFVEPSQWEETIERINTTLSKQKNYCSQVICTQSKKEKNLMNNITSTPPKSNNSIEKIREKKDTHSALEDLKAMIGLSNIKKEVSTLRNFIITQNLRSEKGLKVAPISYHCVFSGNPGTGKTTVARILSKIYQELGILKEGHLVETDRSGLVAEYVGQTAIKTNKIIDKALDGVLFIDEAYSLITNSENDFGREAIATLLKRMEDDRDRLIVILAGYNKEMTDFINSNPGLKSRFRRNLFFPDYSEEECFQIYFSLLKEYEYTITDEASLKIKKIINSKIKQVEENFGNARYIRNLFEKTVENQSNRLALIENPTEIDLTTITADDINPNG